METSNVVTPGIATSNTHKTAQEALDFLRARAKEHDESRDQAYQEYAAGLRDAITALEPFLDHVLELPVPDQAPAEVTAAYVVALLEAGGRLFVKAVGTRSWVRVAQRDDSTEGFKPGGAVVVPMPVFESLVESKQIVPLEDEWRRDVGGLACSLTYYRLAAVGQG